jgi:hypothetical protein
MKILKKLQSLVCPPHSICKECKVHFEPAGPYEHGWNTVKWADLCPTHRKPAMERDSKRDRVIAWAGENWERLFEQMEKKETEKAERLHELQSKYTLAIKDALQHNPLASNPLAELGGPPLSNPPPPFGFRKD